MYYLPVTDHLKIYNAPKTPAQIELDTRTAIAKPLFADIQDFSDMVIKIGFQKLFDPKAAVRHAHQHPLTVFLLQSSLQ